MDVDLRPSVVRVLAHDGTTVGAGFVASAAGLIVTCAHVVRDAGSAPGGSINVVFLATGEQRQALVDPTFWRDPSVEDVAVLRVATPLPDGTLPLLLGSSGGTSGHEFVTFGFPADEGEGGSPGYGKLGEPADQSGWLIDGTYVHAQKVRQLTGTTEVTTGFSGGPVYDRLRRRVVGMVRTIARPDEFGRRSQTAYATPCETLRQVCPPLHVSDQCPYPGLRAFEEHDAKLFFGRERTLKTLLGRPHYGSRLLAVLGPSGSGKSSLLQAGLIPQLCGGELPGSQHWEALVIRPTDDPFGAMGRSGILCDSEDLQAGVHEWLTAHPTATRLLLVLDPFEELLRTCPKDRFNAFVAQLTHVVDTIPEMTLILVMRDDFYPQLLQQWPGLGEELPSALVNVPWELERDELRKIITGPAQSLGFELETGLVDQIIQDAVRSATAQTHGGPIARGTVLPLLQFALRQTWELRRDGVLTHDAYRAAGGVDGALPQWAERAWIQLGSARQPTARGILTGLVHLGDESQSIPDVPQRRALAELCPEEDQRDAVHEVAHMLADARLLVTSGDESSGEGMVELISPALLRWDKLRAWVDKDRRFLSWRQELERRGLAWFNTNSSDPSGRDPGRLLHGRELTDAESWLAERGKAIREDEQKFIRFAVHDREREMQRREQERTERERLQKRNLRLAAALAAAALLLLLATTFLWRRAERQRQIALAQYLAGESQALQQSIVNALPRAALLAVESLRRYPAVGGSQALQNALTLLPHPVARMTHDVRVTAVAFSLDGIWVASATSFGDIQVWEAATGHEVARMSHESMVNAVALSLDSRWVVSASDDNTARVWEAATGRELARMRHENWVTAVAFSPDGRWVVSGSQDNTARVWEAATGRELARMTHEGWVTAVAFGSDGRWVASASEDSTVRVWEAATGRELARMTHDYEVSALALDPNGSLVASGSMGVRVWDAPTGDEVARMGSEMYVTALAFSSDGTRVASASYDGTVWVWEAASGNEVARMTNADFVRALAFSPDGTWLASASFDNTARVWEAATGREVARMTHEDQVNGVAFSPNGTWVVSASDDGTARVWEAFTRHEVAHSAHYSTVDVVAFSPDGRWVASGSTEVWVGEAASGREVALMTHESNVKALAFSHDGNWLASASFDNTARVWEAATGRELARMTHQDWVNAVAFSPEGRWVVSGSRDNTVRVWEAASGRELARMTHQDWVNAVAFSREGALVASASDDNTARVWEAATGREVARMTHERGVTSLAFSPDGTRVASASYDGVVCVWEAATGREVARMTHQDWVDAVAFSPDGNWLASASFDNTARVWEAATGREVARMTHESNVNALAFSPDGCWVASASDDNTARVWEAATGREVARMTHGDEVAAVAFRPDGRSVATGCRDGTFQLWLWRPEDMIAEACTCLSDNLTEAQWRQYLPGEPYRKTCSNLP